MGYRTKVKVKDRLPESVQPKGIKFKYRLPVIIGSALGLVLGSIGTVIYWTSGEFGYKVSSVFKYMTGLLLEFSFLFLLIGGLLGFTAGMLIENYKKK